MFAAALLAAACGRGSARRGEPLVGRLVTTEASEQRGKLVFLQQCYRCHPGGEGGLGPSLNDKRVSLSRARSGFGHAARPGPAAARLQEPDLSDLVAYLSALRRHTERLHEPFEAREAGR